MIVLFWSLFQSRRTQTEKAACIADSHTSLFRDLRARTLLPGFGGAGCAIIRFRRFLARQTAHVRAVAKP